MTEIINTGSFEGGPYLTKQQFANYQASLSTPVSSVNGKTGTVVLAAADVGALASVPSATTSAEGGVKQIAHIVQLTAAPTMADFNGLLTALQTAGIMAAS